MGQLPILVFREECFNRVLFKPSIVRLHIASTICRYAEGADIDDDEQPHTFLVQHYHIEVEWYNTDKQ